MEIEGVEHVGIAVGDLEACVKTFQETFGVKCKVRERIEASKVEIAAFDVGGTAIELVAPAAEGSPVSRFLAERGNGIHHICLKVKDIEACLEELKQQQVELIDKTPRQGSGGHTVAFISPKSVFGILIELSERK